MSARRIQDSLVIVVCPLEVERQAVARAIAAAGLSENLVLVRTGPGPRAMAGALDRLDLTGVRGHRGDGRPRPSLVVLAGLGGGLRDGDAVPRVGTVIDGAGGQWTTWEGTEHGAPATVIGVDEPVWSPADKRDLHSRTAADVVDTESHIVAAACSASGVRWTVVRGVSDGCEEELPRQVAGWVDLEGRTRIGQVAVDLLRRPRLIGAARRLGAASRMVLPRVGERVVEVIRMVQAAGTAGSRR